MATVATPSSAPLQQPIGDKPGPNGRAAEAAFSIFSSVITVEHREFYERIVSELNGVLPICTQGKCTALEVSDDATEQEQITDLMKRVESFSGELLEVTKQLFDQFYQAKEHFCRMIHGATAYLKINLLDRNLLERTCDVRWWALETAFSECLETRKGVRTRLAEVRAAAPASPAADDFDRLLSAAPRWEVDSAANNRLRKHLTALAGLDAARRAELEALAVDVETVLKRTAFACDRLEDVNSSYTLYRDLVLVGDDGMVIANSNKTTRPRVLGLNVADENWFQQALATKDGTQYHAQDLTSALPELK